MFVDASAVIAILASEPDAKALLEKIEASRTGVFYSPSVAFEAVQALVRLQTPRTARIENKDKELFDSVDQLVVGFFEELEAIELPIDSDVGALARKAARDFGKRGHPAQLNFGDCLAYGCAKAKSLPLLFKGNDFVHTDIEAA